MAKANRIINILVQCGECGEAHYLKDGIATGATPYQFTVQHDYDPIDRQVDSVSMLFYVCPTTGRVVKFGVF